MEASRPHWLLQSSSVLGASDSFCVLSWIWIAGLLDWFWPGAQGSSSICRGNISCGDGVIGACDGSNGGSGAAAVDHAMMVAAAAEHMAAAPSSAMCPLLEPEMLLPCALCLGDLSAFSSSMGDAARAGAAAARSAVTTVTTAATACSAAFATLLLCAHNFWCPARSLVGWLEQFHGPDPTGSMLDTPALS